MHWTSVVLKASHSLVTVREKRLPSRDDVASVWITSVVRQCGTNVKPPEKTFARPASPCSSRRNEALVGSFCLMELTVEKRSTVLFALSTRHVASKTSGCR